MQLHCKQVSSNTRHVVCNQEVNLIALTGQVSQRSKLLSWAGFKGLKKKLIAQGVKLRVVTVGNGKYYRF